MRGAAGPVLQVQADGILDTADGSDFTRVEAGDSAGPSPLLPGPSLLLYLQLNNKT
jgi:hypothetical protein